MSVFFSPIVIFFIVTSAIGAELEVLAPVEGYSPDCETIWSVVRADGEPGYTVNGKPVEYSGFEEDGVYHQRITLGGEIVVSRGERSETLKLKPCLAGDGAKFHKVGEALCKSCHEFAPNDCKGCHQDHGLGKHEKQEFFDLCSVCHKGVGLPANEEMAAVCGRCHKKHSLKKHPKLRHAVTSANDPLRPGHMMDCASCHNPHDPMSPGNLSRPEKRAWCRTCHKTP
ncbi:MAG: hypothetical protein C0608_02315 [Deltaproteobacteria bacterium]|nr:MAG: hypothetical protein C0608_02315 [Deltaproteobacteria bacterium]